MKTESTRSRSTRLTIGISILTILAALLTSIIASSCGVGGGSYSSATFTSLPSVMTTVRAHHAQVTLQNGDVLITGGASSFSPTIALDTAEIFNPSTNTFTAISNKMQSARTNHTATLLPDGKVLLAGGRDNNGNELNTVEIFDPTTQSFTVVPGTMSVPRSRHAAVLLNNGTVLVMGGFLLGTAEVFHPVTNTFTSLSSSMTISRWDFTASLLPNGRVLIAGGDDGAYGSSNTAEIYDSSTGSFNAIASTMVDRRKSHSASPLSNGNILITGGYLQFTSTMGGGDVRNTAEVFNSNMQNFSAVSSTMTIGRTGHASSLLANGSVLFTGGSTVSGITDSAEKFGNEATSPPTYKVGGSISGLSNPGLVLANGADTRTIAPNASGFTMRTALPSGTSYSISVDTQPTGGGCTVANGSGTMPAAEVSSVQISCVASWWVGTKQFGFADVGDYSHHTSARSVATDASGNVYVASISSAIMDLWSLIGERWNIITKYDSNGNRHYMLQQIKLVADADGLSIATDISGNIYLVGSTTVGLDGNTLTGSSDFFVTKYDSLGSKLYTRQLGVAGTATFGNAVATDANGNVYVAGDTWGGLDGNTLTGSSDFFVTKYDSLGNKLYTRQLGVAGASTYGKAVATDVNGNVYVAGDTRGGLDGNTLTGSSDFFVAKYDSLGSKLHTRQLGVAGANTFGNAIATDASGNVYVAGSTNGGLDGNARIGRFDLFVTKYDSNGIKQ